MDLIGSGLPLKCSLNRRAFLAAIAAAVGVRKASVPAVRIDGIPCFAQAQRIVRARVIEKELANPAWVLYDVCSRGGWRPDELDLASFQDAARECSRII